MLRSSLTLKTIKLCRVFAITILITIMIIIIIKQWEAYTEMLIINRKAHNLMTILFFYKVFFIHITDG